MLDSVEKSHKRNMDMKSNKLKSSVKRNIIYGCIICLIFFVLIELAGRVTYYQVHGSKMFAILGMVGKLQNKIHGYRLNKIVEKVHFEVPGNASAELYKETGRELLAEFKNQYEQHFVMLLNETKRIGSKLIVLYIPIPQEKTEKTVQDDCRKFYRELSNRHDVHFLDVTEVMYRYPDKHIYLLPEDDHLSRFGSQIVVDELSKVLSDYSDFRSEFRFLSKPSVWGDLKPNEKRMWSFKPDCPPTEVITNKQGFRMRNDLKETKDCQRILILGDSYTFGPYLPNCHTYPGWLQHMHPDKEIINAGYGGYGIQNEVEQFLKSSKYSEPDITILQVLNNDITQMFSIMRTFSGKHYKFIPPSDIEKHFLEVVRQKSQNKR